MTKKDNAAHPLLLKMERLVTMYAQMSESEKVELAAWEQAHVTGDGAFGTSDWPGWKAVVDRFAH